MGREERDREGWGGKIGERCEEICRKRYFLGMEVAWGGGGAGVGVGAGGGDGAEQPIAYTRSEQLKKRAAQEASSSRSEQLKKRAAQEASSTRSEQLKKRAAQEASSSRSEQLKKRALTGTDSHATALNDAVGLPRLHGSGALLGGGRVGEDGEAVL